MGHMWSLKQLGEIITIDMDNIFKSLKIFPMEFIKTVWLSDWTHSHYGSRHSHGESLLRVLCSLSAHGGPNILYLHVDG